MFFEKNNSILSIELIFGIIVIDLLEEIICENRLPDEKYSMIFSKFNSIEIKAILSSICDPMPTYCVSLLIDYIITSSVLSKNVRPSSMTPGFIA